MKRVTRSAIHSSTPARRRRRSVMFTRPHSARWTLTAFRLASHHLSISRGVLLRRSTHTFTRAARFGLAVTARAPHTMLRNQPKALSQKAKIDVKHVILVLSGKGGFGKSTVSVNLLFSRGGGKKAAEDLGVPYLGAIPLDPEMVKAGDEGRPIILQHADSRPGKRWMR